MTSTSLFTGLQHLMILKAYVTTVIANQWQRLCISLALLGCLDYKPRGGASCYNFASYQRAKLAGRHT